MISVGHDVNILDILLYWAAVSVIGCMLWIMSRLHNCGPWFEFKGYNHSLWISVERYVPVSCCNHCYVLAHTLCSMHAHTCCCYNQLSYVHQIWTPIDLLYWNACMHNSYIYQRHKHYPTVYIFLVMLLCLVGKAAIFLFFVVLQLSPVSGQEPSATFEYHLLVQENEHTGILNSSGSYYWEHSPFGPCSETCGGGKKWLL